MSVQAVVVDAGEDETEYRRLLCEWFAETDPDHGTEFDDGRRWCGGCEAPRWPSKSNPDLPSHHMVCFTCKAIWPEYVRDIAETIIEEGVGAFEDVESSTHH